MKKNLFLIAQLISWITIMAINILFARQTNSINGRMWLVLLIITIVIYTPFFIRKNYQKSRGIFYYNYLALLASTFILVLGTVAAFLNHGVYIGYVQIGMLIAGLIGIIANILSAIWLWAYKR